MCFRFGTLSIERPQLYKRVKSKESPFLSAEFIEVRVIYLVIFRICRKEQCQQLERFAGKMKHEAKLNRRLCWS